ncbi:MAG: ShlB/FhaC/HecB family hemolysin secretion/activation protein [Halobacteria archaeon]|nr:ShlB/FhaC/HecB family hemolysin secretion/activation protein [Halobacteria archaeon]
MNQLPSQLMSTSHPLCRAIALFGAALLFSPILSAAPPSLQVLPGVVDRPPVELPPMLTGEEVDVPVQEPQPVQPSGDGTVIATLSRIMFGGELLLDEVNLQNTVAPYLQRPITTNDIAQMKYALTSLYYKKGYVLVKVTTPPQDLSDGIMDVVIIAGRIGQINMDNDVLNENIANSRVGEINSGDVFNERDVETALQDINELTNISASVNLRPGQETGTTDLDLLVRRSETDEDVQIFTIDNYGSKFTGRGVARLSLQKSNMMGLGESLGITGRKSNDDFWAVQGEALFPLPLHNLQLELDYLRSDNSIGDIFTPLDSSGESEVFQAALSSALVNQRQRKWVIRGGIERGEYESFLAAVPDTSDTITKVFAETSFSLRKSRLITFLSLRANKGIGALDADDQGEADASRLTGDPRAWTIESLLYANARLTDRDYASFVLQGQYADAVVLSSDLFTVGGYGSVRGYEPAQSTGDSGASLNADLYRQFDIPDSRWYAQAGPFVDWGYVHNRVTGSTLENNIYSIGLGAEVNYRHSGKLVSKLRLDWGHPLVHKSLPEVDSNTFYARFTQLF